MGKPGTDNSVWIARVRSLLRDGYGVEDIALRLKCSADDVRREVQILRDAGVLKDLFRKVGA